MWVIGLLADTQCVTDGQTDETCASCKGHLAGPRRKFCIAMDEHFVLPL